MGISSFYAVVPVQVLHDNLLKPMERILYAELWARTGTGRYCVISLEEMSRIYVCTEQTIRSYLDSLEKCGYIKIEPYKEKLKITMHAAPRRE